MFGTSSVNGLEHLCTMSKTWRMSLNPSSKGYESFGKNLPALRELNKLPFDINIRRLDDGDGLKKTLAAHTGKWRKACYVMCNATKVTRAIRLRGKAIQETPDSPVKKHLRSAFTCTCAMSVDQKHLGLPTCFFCDETTEEMHRAATMHCYRLTLPITRGPRGALGLSPSADRST